jgi:DNA-binding GntR family transcriptional regulator
MGDMLKVNMNEYLPLRDVVFNTLREAILKGELKPGERLMEIQLADRLGVSRTPIREAIRKLELEGLVIMIPRKGAEVAQIKEKDLSDVLVVRCTLEELAIQIACENITKQEIEDLRKALKEFKRALNSKDVTLIAEKDVKFHDIIFHATYNQRLIQILNNLREQMYRYRVEYLKNQDVYDILVAEHEGIIEALENKDEKRARELIRQHISNQEMTVKRNINEKV